MYSTAERRANVKKQLRGKDGKWLFMGSLVKWFDSFKGDYNSGTVSGFDEDYAKVDTPDGPRNVHRSKLTSVPKKASLPGVAQTPTVKDISEWEKGSGLGGSNGASIYTDPDGNQYVVKFPKSDDHARNEVLASRLYSVAGTPTPQQEFITLNGKTGIASPMLQDTQGDLKSKLNDPDFINKVREDFAVDAWLSNWDVAGLNYDNILADSDGNPQRVDPGGSLLYRAQGSPKGGAFNEDADEWESLRTSPQGKTIFGEMSEEQAANSAQKLKEISDEDIDTTVDSVNFDEDTANKLKDILKARRDIILSKIPDTAAHTEPSSMFTPLKDSGASGDGYHESGPWGKFGAAGLAVQADDTGKYLILQRGDGLDSHQGKWQLPGGALNSKENPYQGAARETTEELKVSQDYLDTLQHQGDVVFDNGKGWQYTNIAANAPTEFTPDVDGFETSDAKWVTAEELQQMKTDGDLVPAFADNIDAILEKFNGPSGETEKVNIPEAEAEELGGSSVYELGPDLDAKISEVLGDNTATSILELDDGTKLMVDGEGASLNDPDLPPLEILLPGKEMMSGNWIPISDKELQSVSSPSEAIKLKLQGNNYLESRTSSGPSELDSLPVNSQVHFSNADPDKVYTKNSDGTWNASWLDGSHPQKNVTSDQIHAVASFLGEDVQVHSDIPTKEDPAYEYINEKMDNADAGDTLYFTDDAGKYHDFKKTSDGYWVGMEEGDIYSPEDLKAYFPGGMKKADIEELKYKQELKELKSKAPGDVITVGDDVLQKQADGSWKDWSTGDTYTAQNILNLSRGDFESVDFNAKNPDLLKEHHLLPDHELSDFLYDAPVGSKLSLDGVSGELYLTKKNQGEWSDQNLDSWSDIEINGQADTSSIIDFIKGDGTHTTPVVYPEEYKVDGYRLTENNLQKILEDLPVGSSFTVTGNHTFTKNADGSWSNGFVTVGSASMANEFSPNEFQSITTPSEKPFTPEKKTAVQTVNGISIDSGGDQFLSDKNGDSISAGSIVQSKAGENGKIVSFPKGGGKVKVETEDGNTKVWNSHLVTVQPDSSFNKQESKYDIKTDSNGDNYLTAPTGDNIYVGDTVTSSGKTGFTGEVVGLKNGFVLVKDPTDGKVKPRKIDKISSVQSNKDQTPASQYTEGQSLAGMTKEEFDSLPEGFTFGDPDDEIHMKVLDNGSIEIKNDPYKPLIFKKGSKAYDAVFSMIYSYSYMGGGTNLSDKTDNKITSAKQLEDLPVGSAISYTNSYDKQTTLFKNESGNWSADPEASGGFTSEAFESAGGEMIGKVEVLPASAIPPSTGTEKPTPTPPLTETDPSSPWFEKPEPQAPDAPQLNTDYAIDGLLDEISTAYKAKNGKDFTDSSYFHQYEQLAKNGSSIPTVMKNEEKYGPQSDLFDFFKARGYLTPESAQKAREHFKGVKDSNLTAEQEYSSKKDQYSSDLTAWKIANGVPLNNFNSSTYQLSNRDSIYELMDKSTPQYLDSILSFSDTLTSKDKHALKSWVGMHSQYGEPGSPDYLPAISWTGLSTDLRSNGKMGFDNPSLLETDHAVVSKAITEAIDKMEVTDEFVMTRKGAAQNFVDSDGKPLSSVTDIKALVGSVLADYGIFAGSPGNTAGYGAHGNNLTIRVRVPKGAHVGWLSGTELKLNNSENEVILPPGSKFYIHAVTNNTVIADLVPEDWTPAAGQTTQAINKN